MKRITYALLMTTCVFSTLIPHSILDDVRAGNKQAIRKRIEDCQNCAEKDENGNNALHIAAQEGTEDHAEIIDMLTTEPDYSNWGAWFYGCFYAPTLPNKNEKNKEGKVPLHCSIERGHVAPTEKLIAKKADPSIADQEGISPVFSIVRHNKPHLIPLLIKHQLINHKKDGKNLLHYSIEQNQSGMVEKLADNTTLTHEQNNEGKNAAMLAAEKKEPTILQILHKQGVSLTSRNNSGRQPIHSSAAAGSYQTAKYLLDNGAYVDATDNNDDTPLLLSTHEGKIDVVNLFLAYKADPKKRNKKGKDILAVAVAKQWYELVKRFKQIPEVNIDRRDEGGRTEFINATIARDYSMMSVLSNCGADVYLADYQGETSLHKVARNGDTGGLSMLKDAFGQQQHWNKVNNKGDTPIFIAARNGHLDIIRMLLHGGGSLEGTNKQKETIFHQVAQCNNTSLLTEIITHHPHVDINAQSAQGLSALHYAATYDNVEMMRAFERCGGLYTITRDGNTEAHSAASSGAVTALKELKHRMPMMVHHRNKDNHTPFIVASAHGHIDAVKLLFHENDIINRDISAAITLAEKHNHAHIVRFLKQAEKDRMNECAQLSHRPQEIITAKHKITALHQQLAEKDGWHIINLIHDDLPCAQQYSANDLYYMTQAERAAISLEYDKVENKVMHKKRELENKLNLLRAQEQEQIRKEEERIRKAQLAEEQRQEALRAQMRAHEAAKQAQVDRIAREQQAEQDRKLQEAELKKYNDEKKKKDQIIADQKAEFDRIAQQKAITDAAKHAAALEKQQAHAPMNLQPSAPAMEPKIAAPQCAACGGKAPTKPLPCVKCKKKVEGVCAACVKKYAGRCPGCFELHTLGVEKQKGECFMCIEKNIDVTRVPCNTCKIRNEHICKECLNDWVNENKKNNIEGKCPLCTEPHMLDEKKVKIILT